MSRLTLRSVHRVAHAISDRCPTRVLYCRQQNFSVALVGATTEDALLEKRAAEFEAAEAVRLKVSGHAFNVDRTALALGCVAPRADHVVQLCTHTRKHREGLYSVLRHWPWSSPHVVLTARGPQRPWCDWQELEDEEAALWAQQISVAQEESQRARAR